LAGKELSRNFAQKKPTGAERLSIVRQIRTALIDVSFDLHNCFVAYVPEIVIRVVK
jgi:hypothetical protein